MKTFQLNVILSINLLVTGIYIGASARAQEITLSTLRGSLDQTVRRLDSCHIVAVSRGSQALLQDPRSGVPPVVFMDIWLSGDCAQIRLMPSSATGSTSQWWKDSKFRSLDSPLSAKNVDKVPGMKACLRPRGDFVWAESRLMDPESFPDYKSLYSRSSSMRPAPVFYLPLVHIGRQWGESQRGAWFAINSLLEIPLESWKMIGPTTLGNTKTVLVEIARQEPLVVKLKRREEPLSIIPLWKIWFSADPDQGYFPLRIEASAHYVFGGKEYPTERTQASAPASLVFEAREITKFGDGLWYPRSGKEEYFSVDVKNPIPFDGDKIVDNILHNGKFINEHEYLLGTRREWRVLSLDTIEPTNDFWFDPPPDSCVLDLNTNARFIVGLSPEESRRKLQLDVAQDAISFDNEAQRNPGWRWTIWMLIGLNSLIVFVLAIRFLTRGSKKR